MEPASSRNLVQPALAALNGGPPAPPGETACPKHSHRVGYPTHAEREFGVTTLRCSFPGCQWWAAYHHAPAVPGPMGGNTRPEPWWGELIENPDPEADIDDRFIRRCYLPSSDPAYVAAPDGWEPGDPIPGDE